MAEVAAGSPLSERQQSARSTCYVQPPRWQPIPRKTNCMNSHKWPCQMPLAGLEEVAANSAPQYAQVPQQTYDNQQYAQPQAQQYAQVDTNTPGQVHFPDVDVEQW